MHGYIYFYFAKLHKIIGVSKIFFSNLHLELEAKNRHMDKQIFFCRPVFLSEEAKKLIMADIRLYFCK